MGRVYEATHARLAGRYAIKVLLRKLSEDPEALARFHREAKITSLLQHPNVVEVIDYNTAADGTEYLVMEYLAGESLAQRLFREGPMPLETVVGIIEQIAAGLAAAHAHGIVHRDLKPDNVFLVPVEGREAESVKILDFGISKVKGPSWGLQAPEGTLCGTPQYMSPEQIESRVADVDAATDQFALAVLAYEMLTGRNPFQGDTVGAVFSQVLNGIPAPTGIGRNIDLVVRRGLAKANRQRFPCVTDFSDALRTAATGGARESQWLATIAYASGEISNLNNKGWSRRRALSLGLVAVVASLSMSFVGGGTGNHRSPHVRTLSAVPSAATLPHFDDAGQAPPNRQITLTDRRDEIPTSQPTPKRIESHDSRQVGLSAVAAIEATHERLRPQIVPLIVSVPTRTAHRSVSGARWPNHLRQTSLSAISRPRPAATTSFPVDDDATLPLDETLGDAR